MISIILIVGVIIAILYYLFPLIQVVGDSMHPTYCNNEIIVGIRFYRKSNLKKGDVIVYHAPDGRIVIKRIDNIIKDKMVLNKNLFNQVGTYYYCIGDNLDHSYDSRSYGYISSKEIVCKILNQRRNNNVCNQEGRNT